MARLPFIVVMTKMTTNVFFLQEQTTKYYRL